MGGTKIFSRLGVMAALVLLTLPMVPASVSADETHAPRSIMFGDGESDASERSININTHSDPHCDELHHQIEALKGKPQRRKAAADRYQRECVGN